MAQSSQRFESALILPCGANIKNRFAKSAMSDSLADGKGNATEAQARLYEKWSNGGAALSFVGEVQGNPHYPENPGNLVLNQYSDFAALNNLTKRAVNNHSHLWAQIGHAGALSYLPLSRPKGPSALNLAGLQCAEMSVSDIQALPNLYAKTAQYAKEAGFSGVHIHAGHGFLLSQFLSPLFNHRSDQYGGVIEARCQIILDIINEVRKAVGSSFPIGIRINSSDQLEGGLTELEALRVVFLLNQTSIDLIDISGGTYFPGAKASSEGTSEGPYFLNFAKQTRKITDIPIMLTGGFKHREQALAALTSGAVDIIGLARLMVLDPNLANNWLVGTNATPTLPTFECTVPGGITAWYTMLLTALGEDKENAFNMTLTSATEAYEKRNAERTVTWKEAFSRPSA